MPVRKFRSVEEMNAPPRRAHPFEVAADNWQRSQLLFPRRFPPGVYKHRSIESANALRERWLRDAISARR